MNIEGVPAPSVNNSVNINPMTGKIDVYYAPPSPMCRSVIMFAKALGLKFNLKPVDLMAGEHMTAAFIKMNPQHTVPTIIDDGFVLWESRAIMKYLLDQHGKENSYFPTDPKQAAVVNQRLYFDATTLTPRLTEYYLPVIFHGQPPNVDKKMAFEEALQWLDGFLEKTMWVAGQQMSIADFAIIANVSTAEAVGFDLTQYPNVAAWYERARKGMASYGYEEVNQEGADILGKMFRSKLN